MPQPQRDTAVDVLRGFGMLLVVVGHLYSGPWTHYIYSFHMPLFFFLSGFCAARKERQEPFGQYVLKKCRTLLLPYVVFFFLSLLIIFFLYHDKPSVWTGGLSVPAVLKALVLSGGYLIRIPLYNYPLWYLPHLFVADLIFYWLRRGFALLPRIWLQRTAAGAVALALMLVTLPVQAALPYRPILQIDAMPAALSFMLLGWLLEPLTRCKAWDLAPWLCPVLLLGGWLLQSLNDGGSISSSHSLLYYPAALSSILGWYCVSQRFRSPILAFIGQESILFLGLHLNVYGRLVRFPCPAFLTSETVYDLLQLLAGTAVLCLIALLLRAIKHCFHRRAGG